VVIGVVPEAIVIAGGPERVVEYVGVGVGPEHRAVPRHKSRAQAVPPGSSRRPVRSTPTEMTIAGTRRKARREAALPCLLRGYIGNAIAAQPSLRSHVGLRFRRRRRLPVCKRALLTCMTGCFALMQPALMLRGAIPSVRNAAADMRDIGSADVSMGHGGVADISIHARGAAIDHWRAMDRQTTINRRAGMEGRSAATSNMRRGMKRRPTASAHMWRGMERRSTASAAA